MRGANTVAMLSGIPGSIFQYSAGTSNGRPHIAVGDGRSCNLFLVGPTNGPQDEPKVVAQKHVRVCHLCASIGGQYRAPAPLPASGLPPSPSPSQSNPAIRREGPSPANSHADSMTPGTASQRTPASKADSEHGLSGSGTISGKTPCEPMASPSTTRLGPTKVDWSALWSLVTAVLVLGSVAALVYAVWCGQSSTKYSPLDTAGIEMVVEKILALVLLWIRYR